VVPYLIVKNRSGRQFLGAAAPEHGSHVRLGGGHEGRAPLLRNYLLCALAGTCWYFQFFFYTMGESQMGRYGFSSWTLHMASIIIFASLWGIALHEWRGSSTRTKGLLGLGLLILVGSTIVIGVGNMMAKA
jgi:L-rhamnose-H+ transport protein